MLSLPEQIQAEKEIEGSLRTLAFEGFINFTNRYIHDWYLQKISILTFQTVSSLYAINQSTCIVVQEFSKSKVKQFCTSPRVFYEISMAELLECSTDSVTFGGIFCNVEIIVKVSNLLYKLGSHGCMKIYTRDSCCRYLGNDSFVINYNELKLQLQRLANGRIFFF